jgi:hypothetical protein
MRYTHPLPELTFELGTIVFSPGMRAGLLSSSSGLRPFLDHVLECHAATDFGIVSRAMRFDNVLAALMDTGQLTSRFYIHPSICPPETVVIITTHLDERTTTIRFASEQL